MAVVEVSIVPLGTGTPSVSKYVARAIRVLSNEAGIKYHPTSMGTIIEGELGAILDVIRRMHESVFDDETLRVVTTIRIDDRKDKQGTMAGKMGSLMRELG